MDGQNRKNHTPEILVAMYVAAKKRRQFSLSTRKAIRALRAVLPACNMSDEELANIVANAAVEAGLAVEFDERNVERF